MRHATRDHGEIIHWAGRHARNPVLDGNARLALNPAGPPQPGEKRIGWDAFFPTFDARHLALLFDDSSDWHAIAPPPEAEKLLREG